MCNGSSAVLGLGMQFTIGSVPSLGAITSFQWTSSTGFTSTQQYPILNNPQPGTYTLTIQAPGCGSVSATLTLSTTSTNCPNAAFTNTSGVICSGNSVSFTNNSTPGGLSYFWLFGDGGTASTSNTSHVYTAPQGTGITNYTAALVVVNAAGVMDVQQIAIQVQQIPPEPQLNSSQYQLYNNQDYLVACTDLSNDYIFITGLLNSPGAWAQSFTINWGDGSPIESFSAPLTFTNHLYPLGLYTLTITMLGPNGCSISNTYKVFVGNTPAVNLGSPGNTERCAPYTFNFPIENVGNNEIGTTYVVTFSDGGATQTFNHPPPAFFTHTFTQSSCGQTSLNNLPDAFWVQITAQNPCANQVATIEPIRISTPPVAQFTALPDPVCINSTVTVNSTADPGTNVNSAGCNTNHGMVWSISPATGWSLASGTLGSDNAQPNNYTAWTSGSTQLQLSFSVAGNYTITQRIRNSCGEDVATEIVCVVPPLTANFTLSGAPCAPSVLSTDNLTTPINTCVAPVYVWSINPIAPFDANVPPFTANSFEPEWLLTQEGLYTINLSATNVCETSTATNNFTIVAPPDVNLTFVPPGCAPYTVDPSVTYDDGGGTITLQQWQINGGAWQTITPAEPVDFPPQVFNAGTHTIKVRITNECGTDSSSVTFTVTNPPAITVSDFAVCSGVAEIINNGSPTVNPATGAPPITYVWSGNGLSNTGISNPSITLPGVGSQIITLTATDALGCFSTDNITVTINPLPVLSPVPNAMCIGSPAVPLSVSSNISGTSFSWSPSTGLNTTSGSIVLANPPSTTTFTITGTVGATGCSSDTTVVLTVNPLPVVDTAPILQVCAQAIPVELNQGTPPGGVWTDPTPASGTLSQVGGIYFYTPPTNPGNDILTYTYTDPNGCVNSDNMPVQILTVDPAVAGPDFSVCNNAPVLTLSTGAPTGGVWSGSGVVLNGNTFQFNPASLAPGAYWLFYTINANTNCEFTDSLLATVFPVASVSPLSDEVCSGVPVTLTPSVSGGTAPLSYVWSPNTGLQGPSNQPSATFIHSQTAPNDALYNYTFTVTDVNNCVAGNAVQLTVHPLPLVDVADLTSSLCTQPIPFQMNVQVVATGGSGLWSGSNITSSGLFTPPPVSGSQWVYYTYNDANGCINEDSTLIDLIVPVVPDAGLPLSFCLNAPSLILTPATNPGGVWTGPGVNAGIFNPLLAGVGTHNLTYTI
ncbi:MAG: PKD domain-containing protein, partial [Bacteroidia bacterium]